MLDRISDHLDLEAEGLHAIADEQLPSDIASVGPTIDRILERLRAKKLAVGKEGDLRLVLREAMTNALAHGRDESVRLIVASDPDDAVVLIVRDASGAFDPSVIPTPDHGDTCRGSDGRRSFLVRTLMKEASFRDGGREIRMRLL